MARGIDDIIAHLRLVIDNHQISTTLVQAAEMAVLCDAVERPMRLLQRLAWYYQVNDCQDRRVDDCVEVPIGDLREALRAIEAIGKEPHP